MSSYLRVDTFETSTLHLLPREARHVILEKDVPLILAGVPRPLVETVLYTPSARSVNQLDELRETFPEAIITINVVDLFDLEPWVLDRPNTRVVFSDKFRRTLAAMGF